MVHRLVIVTLVLVGSLTSARPSIRFRRLFNRPYPSYHFSIYEPIPAPSETRPSVYYYPYSRRPSIPNYSPGFTYLHPSASVNSYRTRPPYPHYSKEREYDSPPPSSSINHYDNPMFLTPETERKPVSIIPTRRPALYQVPAPLHLERPTTTTSSPYYHRPMFSFHSRKPPSYSRPTEQQPLPSYAYHRPATPPPKPSPLSLTNVKNRLLGKRPPPVPMGYSPPTQLLQPGVPLKVFISAPPALRGVPPTHSQSSKENSSSEEDEEEEEEEEEPEEAPRQNYGFQRHPHPHPAHHQHRYQHPHPPLRPPRPPYPPPHPPPPPQPTLNHVDNPGFPQITVNKPPVFKAAQKPSSSEQVQDDEKAQPVAPIRTQSSYGYKPTATPQTHFSAYASKPTHKPIFHPKPDPPKLPTPPKPPSIFIYSHQATNYQVPQPEVKKPDNPPPPPKYEPPKYEPPKYEPPKYEAPPKYEQPAKYEAPAKYEPPRYESKKPTKDKKETEDYYINSGISSIPGEAGRDYPTLSVLPGTDFTCHGRKAGFYADMSHKCQVYHYCTPTGDKQSFLCPNGTIYNQASFVCEWWYNVDCASSEKNYARNNDLYKVPEAKETAKEEEKSKPNPYAAKSSTENSGSIIKQAPPQYNPNVKYGYKTVTSAPANYRKPATTPPPRYQSDQQDRQQQQQQDDDYDEYYDDSQENTSTQPTSSYRG